MGYTALEKMREQNRRNYGIDGPRTPEEKVPNGVLEREALRFLRENCEELRFVRDEAHLHLQDLDGTSADKGQIPKNMQMDLDRLCLENAIHRFMQSGVAEDAFDVYFCYLEMFAGSYGDTKKMIEMLAEFEDNASSLLMKHRDHYSHSVYVFVLGLAIYRNNQKFRKTYENYYKKEIEKAGYDFEKAAAHHYLRYWGMSALFHDIGYPFELPFEQVKSYFGNSIKDVPFIAYRNIEAFIKLSDEKRPYRNKITYLMPEKWEKENLQDLDINDILAQSLYEKLKETYQDKLGEGADYLTYLKEEVLQRKPGEPDHFNGFMDHAYFSSVILMDKILEMIPEGELNPVYLDVLTAIVLHNSMYKFCITNIKDTSYNPSHRFRMELHPLAYMLMLCDELQCWDRTSYGQNSRKQLHPMWCDLQFVEDRICAIYYYDEKFSNKKENGGTYQKMEIDKKTGKIGFLTDIEEIIWINEEDSIGLEIYKEFHENNRKTHLYLSDSNFIHLYNFATALNAQYEARNGETNEYVGLTPEEMEEKFNEKLSLEYKLSNIAQAKEFARHLNVIGCFYTDRPVAYEMKQMFDEKELDIIGDLEHKRWCAEKTSMGWIAGDLYQKETIQNPKKIRECTRMHKDLMQSYEKLEESARKKDTDPINDMMRLIEEYDGLRVYKLDLEQ